MSDQLPCETCGHYAVACDDTIDHYKEEITDLEKQLAERDAALARCVGDRKSILTPAVCGVSGHFRFQENGGNCLMCQREKRLIDEAVAASAQATAKVQQWQPIETAPKDGTNILLVNRVGNVATGLWQGNGEYECWWLRGGNRPNTFFNHHYGPSYWMPLPELPTEAIREEKEGK